MKDIREARGWGRAESVLCKSQMTPEIEQLFNRTLVNDYDDEDAWNAVSTLRSHGNREIFEIAASWLTEEVPLKRARGAAILAQLRASGNPAQPDWLFRYESFQRIVDLLAGESDSMVLDSAIAALGHLHNEAAIPVITGYADHSDHNVRFSAACALGHFPNNPIATPALLALTRDENSDVRDWAVFGLGVQGDLDSAEMRQALFDRIEDLDEDTREEAVVGLGMRTDLRLLPFLRAMLRAPELKLRVAEAAAAMLGLSSDPEEWQAEDYIEALNQKFGPGPVDS